MPPPRPLPGSPKDWLARAEADLALAKAPLPPGALLEDLCFHAQQAPEKAIKAVYRHAALEFRYTHDVGELLAGLSRCGVQLPPELHDASDLTAFAWESRYPGLAEPVEQEDHFEALRLAELVMAWARGVIPEH